MDRHQEMLSLIGVGETPSAENIHGAKVNERGELRPAPWIYTATRLGDGL